MADSDLPLSLNGLLALLERLGGAEEAEVVRFALEAGVPRERVEEEVRREVERRTRAQELVSGSGVPTVARRSLTLGE